jgi:large subunit ribosomal protein L25
MASSSNTIALSTRAKTGTTGANNARREGKVPGVLFGHGSSPLAIEADARAFDALLHVAGKNHLLEITIDGGSKDTAMLREIQRDPLSRRVLHVDFQRVRANEEIATQIPLVTIGTPLGVRNSGGVMDVVLHTVAVLAPANAIPDSIEGDVSNLDIHGHLTAGDLKLPAGVKLDMDPHAILVSIEASKVAGDVAQADAAAAEAAPAASDVPTVDETAAGAENS